MLSTLCAITGLVWLFLFALTLKPWMLIPAAIMAGLAYINREMDRARRDYRAELSSQRPPYRSGDET